MKGCSNPPTETGMFLWYILDMGYLNVGIVQILMDQEKHRKYLRENRATDKTWYIYKGEFSEFTLYHQAHDHLPPMDENNKPFVDGYIPFDIRTLR